MSLLLLNSKRRWTRHRCVPVCHGPQIYSKISLSQTHGLDVWQATPTHVDIYFPSNSTRSPIKLPFEDFPVLDFDPVGVDVTPWNMSFTTSTFHSSYHPFSEIQDFMSELAKEHPDLIELVNIGRSAEQREMTALKISNAKRFVSNEKNGGFLRPKGAVVITGAQHAREVRVPGGYPAHAPLLIPSLLLSGSQSLQPYTSPMGSLQAPQNATR